MESIPPKVIFRPFKLLALYDIIDNSIIISSAKTGDWEKLGLWEATNLAPFEHLCECESWKFDDDSKRNILRSNWQRQGCSSNVFSANVSVWVSCYRHRRILPSWVADGSRPVLESISSPPLSSFCTWIALYHYRRIQCLLEDTGVSAAKYCDSQHHGNQECCGRTCHA